MKTKTWKIGEYCAGGIIRAKASGSSVKIEVIDSKSKEVIESGVFGRLHEGALFVFLHNVTSSFYADKVTEWVKEVLS